MAGPDQPQAYGQTSFWLETSGDDLTPLPGLSGDLTVDVAILGGGFSGLWTAYHLLKNNPGLEVAILERDICGYGASGRNGGWCSPRFPVDAHALINRVGLERARQTLLALQESVDDIGGICAEEGIEADYRRNGLLNLARAQSHLAGLRATLDTYKRLGLDDDARLLSAQEAFERVHATKILGALHSSAGAAVHPGKLVRGLARAVARRGAAIFERTEVTDVLSGDDAGLVTAAGTVRARKAVVVAGEGYLSGLKGFRRSIVPMSSMIILTEPLGQDKWAQIGWDGGESLCSQVNVKNYLTRTADGRILYGSRGAPYLYGSATPEAATRHEPTFQWMRETVKSWWPALEDVRFTHAWGGYLGVPRDWMPTVHFDASSKLATLHGYTGRGVSTSQLAGRLLAGLIAGRQTGLERLPMHRAKEPAWEAEPFRWAGIRYVNRGLARIDSADEAGKRPSWHARLAYRLGAQR